ncbi:hypothetical protein ABL78_2568 [Leptomonas seymouri]|uniref:Uncharacterized protein n=1 Tax=Leptomonas seymouri TaxID=5684 RepID=A0A0N0P735_LEPSE|nr:hypothetical protein ABL78_2568 [Leptomonas seymouri]|eukprot:KPI88329.1 hypothetical protein ABL78_2568 [Leptomonas seymouri]
MESAREPSLQTKSDAKTGTAAPEESVALKEEEGAADEEVGRSTPDRASSAPPNDAVATITSTGRRKKRVGPPSVSSALQAHVKAEPDDESTSTPMVPPPDEREKVTWGKHDRTLPASTGVSTRRSKSRQHPVEEEEDDEKLEEETESGSSSDMEDSPRPPQSAAPMTPDADAPLFLSPLTTQPNTRATIAASMRSKSDEVTEAGTQEAIQAQVRQLRHTLLSIFPAHLRALSSVCPQQSQDDGGSTSAKGSAAPQRSLSMRCSPEPLVPLLQALCEDKIYVHAAWCRYESDLALRRMQDSIQRKRKRHSSNKTAHKTAPPTAATTTTGSSAGATAVGGRVENDESDSDSQTDDDGNQPPESEWVEAPPALNGPLRTTSSTSIDRTKGGRETALASGFQWTPWRFFREKRRRSSCRSQVNAGAATNAAAAASSLTSQTSSTSIHASANASSTSAVGVPTSAASAITMASAPSNSAAAAVGGGVPPLRFSEVPSLPVLQVDVEVPEDVTVTVEAMTAAEQRNYARYVMSSGKLRNVCREPYSFLVSRAKEMRIQWERQHPFE